MLSVKRAKELVLGVVSATAVEEVPLERARGRVLAETVLADRDFPPTDRSAMDGYAVRAEDCVAPGRQLDVVGEIPAGRAAADELRLGPGQAVRIMTGAIVPAGADAVVQIEQTTVANDGTRVVVDSAVRPGDHVRRRGQDLTAGAVVLTPGSPVHAAEIAALASVGKTRVAVHRAPVVRVLSTGDEIVEASAAPLPHQVRNSNAAALLAQLGELGLAGEYLGIARDDRGQLRRLIEQGVAADVLLVTGGVSVGAYDLVGEVLAEAGVRELFHHVAMRPGKPILAGVRDGCLVLGLPGNPLSTFVGFTVFAAPALRRSMGLAHWDDPELAVRLEQPLHVKGGGRRTYHLARVSVVEGCLKGRAVVMTGSGDVLSLARGNAWLITPEEGGSFPAGATLPALLWPAFHER